MKNRPVTFRPPFCNSGNFVLDSLGMVLAQFMPTEFIRVNGETYETAKWVVDALNSHAAPARNCDMFGGDFKMLHTAWFDWTGSPSGQDPDGTVKLTFDRWLLAPAAQKGGAK